MFVFRNSYLQLELRFIQSRLLLTVFLRLTGARLPWNLLPVIEVRPINLLPSLHVNVLELAIVARLCAQNYVLHALDTDRDIQIRMLAAEVRLEPLYMVSVNAGRLEKEHCGRWDLHQE